MSAKFRRTFWITNSVTSQHSARAKLLESHGFKVFFASDSHTAFKLAREARPICMLIDTCDPNNTSEINHLISLAKDPEFNAVRFILSLSSNCPELIRCAMSEGFRDIVPLAISDSQWLSRVLYANAAKTGDEGHATVEVGLNQIASTISSGRVTWMNQTHVRIECRGPQRIGNSLQISGAFSQALKLPRVSLIVEGIEKQRLLYRYSQALICRWQVPPTHEEAAKKTIQALIKDKPDPKIRAFVAVSRPSLRTTLVKGLDSGKFFVRAGLQKSNLPLELNYFSPSIIFFDDKLLEALSDTELNNLLDATPEGIPIVIFGVASDKISRILSDRKVFFESSVQQTHLRNAEARYEIPYEKQTDGDHMDTYAVSPDHPWSKIDVHTPARLKALSSTGGHISCQFPIGTYSLAKIESPFLRKILGRDPIIKVKTTHSFDSSAMFGHESSFHLADITSAEEAIIAVALVTHVKDHYASKLDGAGRSSLESLNTNETTLMSQDGLLLDVSNTAAKIGVSGFVAGSTALKNGDQTSDSTDQTTDSSARPKLRANNDKKQAPVKAVYKTARKSKTHFAIDKTVAKSIGVFIIFSLLLIGGLKLAEKKGAERGSQLGKEYSDFFFRMNPELRKKSERAEPTDRP